MYYYLDPDLKPPKIAYRFEPDDDTIIFNHGPKCKERLIFPFEGPYTEKEENGYENFLDYWDENSITFPDSMNKRRIMRFIQGNHNNNKKTADNILSTIEWRIEKFPMFITEDIKKYLDRGAIYIHGRDKWFRPVVYQRWSVLSGVDAPLDAALDAWFFAVHFMLENLMIREKIENWIFNMDLDSLPARKIPVKFVIKYVQMTQEVFKCRGRMFFALNVTFAIRLIWNIISPFADSMIRKKVRLTKESFHPDFVDMVHPSQVEKKYGGEAENVTQFWPPYCPSFEFGHDPDQIVGHSTSDDGSAISQNDNDEASDIVHKTPSYRHNKKPKLMTDIGQPVGTEQIVIEETQKTLSDRVDYKKSVTKIEKGDKKASWRCEIF
jgi:hypothetical protein